MDEAKALHMLSFCDAITRRPHKKGGAEMLVVNAAVAARRAGHDVVIYTSHHDETRCFKETTAEGVFSRHARSFTRGRGGHAWCLSLATAASYCSFAFVVVFSRFGGGACPRTPPTCRKMWGNHFCRWTSERGECSARPCLPRRSVFLNVLSF